jgi:hypothetical protein
MCRKGVENAGLGCQALVATASDDPLADLATVAVGSRGRYWCAPVASAIADASPHHALQRMDSVMTLRCHRR